MATRVTKRQICGILNLDKPSGMTSRAVVDCVSRPLRGVKVGHAGTLDPLATGVLVVCVGAATRLIELVQRMPKTYRTVIRLGARSDTLDADGQIVEVESPKVPALEEIHAALAPQIGLIDQLPPEYSALKVAGERAYDLARAGRPVVLQPRQVRIDRIELIRYEWPHLELEIDCGSGTYIRSIARDVGEALGCGGLIEVLTRTRIGVFKQKDALDPQNLRVEEIPDLLRPALDAASGLPQLAIDQEGLAAILQGRALEQRFFGEAAIPAGEVALVGPDGNLAAIGEGDPNTGRVAPRRVLATE
ncbi:tRNA pseudouridine(55) synthase TruB [Singulisphaera sp. PoT]|uniref:tRNA pseudouridine(55) synthase TruB n=1 Tax=Singulisphaera sp. PoT TaxID=3411797 RepID=UPI003BF4F3C9